MFFIEPSYLPNDIHATLRDRRLGRSYTHRFSHVDLGRPEPDPRWSDFHQHEAWSLLCLEPPDHIVEGRSLLPLLRGEDPSDWRDTVFSELDYAFYADVREPLGTPVNRSRTFMVREDRWKYVAFEGFRPQLFDLESDPQEVNDLGEDPNYQDERERLHQRIATWQSGLNYRTTAPGSFIDDFKERETKSGVTIGKW